MAWHQPTESHETHVAAFGYAYEPGPPGWSSRKPTPRLIAVTADHVANTHPAVRTGVQGAVDEHEAGEAPETILARDVDKLECLVQVVEYREQGYSRTQNWIGTSLSSLKTPKIPGAPGVPLVTMGG
ncbi:hypothetical protein [Streptomyces sp. bgisy060]|uniref:hypothetical protein n=1 Tax=Streptomyces sp. bgisy060 TaxID=3413775 RepID=UPI003EBC118D